MITHVDRRVVATRMYPHGGFRARGPLWQVPAGPARASISVVIAPDGIGGVARPALVIVDRHVGGIGLAEALDAATIQHLLRWTWGVLFRCACVEGCATCTPPEVLAAGPDKVGALKLLGG